ncbi:hypothetical protein P22_1987 [Propionispora sp. 2/2-37]|uniref:hypothetical protein n=1 Tax=Propionispora sp. 2/2-37 TaxID=1677858 RepID=UPI0006BB693A|nr:hypothetical protein [Propionispora sp. 2/2-37]CUH95901.1 hypothetical protein P22_1987 [Propionispora sp. 2/2-37]
MRKGDWIETYSGIKFYPLEPYPDDIKIADIAHALSLTCRYNGHCKHFYSVGQHSINVYKYLATLYPTEYALQLIGLLHDASEAYISDVCRPIKPFLINYQKVEFVIQRTVWAAFGLRPTATELKRVKEADTLILHAEAMDLMRNIDSWAEKNDLRIDIAFKNPVDIEKEFLTIFINLCNFSLGS